MRVFVFEDSFGARILRIAITCGFVIQVYFAIQDVKKNVCVLMEVALPMMSSETRHSVECTPYFVMGFEKIIKIHWLESLSTQKT